MGHSLKWVLLLATRVCPRDGETTTQSRTTLHGAVGSAVCLQAMWLNNVVVSRSCVRMTSLLLRSVHRRVGTPGSAWRLEDDVVGRAGWTKATGSRCCGPVGLQLEATPCRGTRPPSSTRGCRAAAPGEEAAASAEDLGARRSAPCWAPMSTRTHALCWARARRRRRRRWSAWTAAGPCWAP